MISIIIVHYGNINKTLNCLNSVVEKTKAPYEILVWNNDEESCKVSMSQYLKAEKIKILTIGKNIGYGAAINRAVKYAKYEYILILNNDIQILSDIKLETLKPNCIYGAQTYNEDGIVNSCYLDLTPFDELFKNLRIYAIIDNIKKWFKVTSLKFKVQISNSLCLPISQSHWTYNVGGHFLFMKKELFEKIGGFDEKFFLYAEEFDLCKRARLLGYKIIYNVDFKVFHSKKEEYGKKNNNSTLNTQHSTLHNKIDIMPIRIDSKLYYIKKHYPNLFIFTLLSNVILSYIYIIILYIWSYCFKVSRFKGLINLRVNELKYYYTTLLKKSLYTLNPIIKY